MKKATSIRIISAFLAVLLIVFVAMQFLPEKPARLEEPAGDEPASAPAMRHDGTLQFFDSQKRPVADIVIEIAETEAARTQGLMGRTSIAENEGMLFIFPEEEERSFWMANTPLPLDIIFVNSAFTIVKIHMRTTPYSEESLPSEKPAKYVVEVNAGFCNKFGIQEGQTLSWIRN